MTLTAKSWLLGARREQKCAIPSDKSELRVSLPIPVLDHLRGMSGSVFVRAYLMSVLASDAGGQHRLVRCAQAFLAERQPPMSTLADNAPGVLEMIDALREAEDRRQRLVAFQVATKDMPGVLQDIKSDTTAGVAVSLKAIARMKSASCGDPCRIVDSVTTVGEKFISALDALAGSRRVRDEAAGRLAETARSLAAAELAVSVDTISTLAARAVTTDTVSRARLDSTLRAARDSVSERRKALAMADTALKLANADVNTKEASLAVLRLKLVEHVDKALATHQQGVTLTAADVLELSATTTRVAEVEAREEVPVVPAVARTDNLVIAVADFVLARAKREAINAFIINLYEVVGRDTLIQRLFPESWALMNRIPKRRGESTLNAQEVGRIPLSTWRATLATDFIGLPVAMVTQAPEDLCLRSEAERSAERARDTTRITAANARLRQCQERLASLAPIGEATARLIRGEPALRVLSDEEAYRILHAFPAEGLSRLNQGLRTMRLIAETFEIQGDVRLATPLAHPYVLTGRSWLAVAETQRRATVRLLYLAALSSVDPGPASELAVQRGLVAAIRALERIATVADTADARGARAALVVRSAFEAYAASADIAAAYVQETNTRARQVLADLDSAEARLRMVSGVIEPMVRRDFGLAMSRAVVAVSDLLDGSSHPRVVTFLGLASSLSQAGTGAEAQAALEAAASPAGGWQAKRYREGAASITAFPGVAMGKDHARHSTDLPEELRSAGVFNVSLPIGFEWQLLPEHKSLTSVAGCPVLICSVNAFIGLVDLGAVLSYRLDDNVAGTTVADPSWTQVLSPGLFLSLPVTQTTPFTILAGAQSMPALRTIDGTTGVVRQRTVIRWSVQFAFDVTLFRFNH